jgi:putative cell wall-binding protein
MREELEELRFKADKVPVLESRMEALQNKVREAAEMKQQVASVREQSADQVKRIVQLEEKERRLVTAEGDLERQKAQVAELQEQLLNEQKRADRFEFACNKAQQDRDRLDGEKKVGCGCLRLPTVVSNLFEHLLSIFSFSS